jgi:transcriptional regulator with XRE-family HTH domain
MTLKEWLKKNNMLLVELAEKVGCSAAHLSDVQNFKKGPSVALIKKLIALSNGALTFESLTEKPEQTNA